MKKIFISVLFVVLAVGARAEMMEFITWLAQPMGVFSTVDVKSSAEDSAKIFFLNFCDEHIDGEMQFKALYAKYLYLNDGTELQSPADDYALKRLVTNLLQMQKIQSVAEDTPILVGKKLTVSGSLTSSVPLYIGSDGALTIPSGTYTVPSASFDKLELTGNNGVLDTVENSGTNHADNFQWKTVGLYKFLCGDC